MGQGLRLGLGPGLDNNLQSSLILIFNYCQYLRLGLKGSEHILSETWSPKFFVLLILILIFRMSDASGSEMSTSVNSDASYDIDIVRHHDGRCHLKCNRTEQLKKSFEVLVHSLKRFYFQSRPLLPTCWMPVTQIQSLSVKRRSADMENRKM